MYDRACLYRRDYQRWHPRVLACCLTLALSLLGARARPLAMAQEPASTGAPAVLLGRVVAVGVPGAGAVLDPTRLLVASTSNFEAPLAQPDIRAWFANALAGRHGAGMGSVLDPNGWLFAGAPHKAIGGVFTDTQVDRQPQQVPGALTAGAVGIALLGKVPDSSGRAVFAVALADGSLVQVHVEHGVRGLAPASTIGALYDAEDVTGNTQPVTRVGMALNWAPDRILYVADPVHNAVAVLTLMDDGSLFRLQRVLHLVNTDLNAPVDVAPAVPEMAKPGLASHTTLTGGSDLYVANRGNGTIVRLRQDGTVVAVRQVDVPGLGPLRAGRLNGIAVSPDATRLWVTVSGALPEFPQADGIVVELPAFGAFVVSHH